MKNRHQFVATNPCHVYELALGLHARGALGRYYSGYPRWRLAGVPDEFPLVERSWRTLLTYGLQRLPERLRPEDSKTFRWQDAGFDRAVAGDLEEGEGYLHGIPGQCLACFEAAAGRGLVRVLNHASGPLGQQRALVEAEYRRVGMDLARAQPLPREWEARLAAEMALAEYHCVASTVVRAQLLAEGVAAERIWVVGYGADPVRFRRRERAPEGRYRIGFVGRRSLRKGIHYLLEALARVGGADWELHLYGMPLAETAADFSGYRGAARIVEHGAVSQAALAEAMRELTVLVLPSVEEAFGLVVVQALSVGVPCLVSDRVGAKDLIREGENGAIFPFGDVEALAACLRDWEVRRVNVEGDYGWEGPVAALLAAGEASEGG